MKNFSAGAALALMLIGSNPAAGQVSEAGLSFNGTSGSVNCGTASALALNGTQAYTLEAWVRTGPYLGSAGTHRSIITRYNAGVGGAWQFVVRNSNTLGFHREASPFWLEGTTGVTVGQWRHVAATYDGTTMRTYVNGVLDVSEARGSATGTTQPVMIGASQNNSSPYNLFHGVMDEVRVWNFAKTSTQLTDGMDTVLTGSESGLIGYWNMDSLANLGAGGDGLANDIEDLSINDNHGDLSAGGVTRVTSDLATSIAESADNVTVGQPVTYSITVKNNGPMLAGSTVLSVDFPGNFTFDSTTLTPGTYTLTGTGLTVDPSDYLDQAQVSFDVVMTAASDGTSTLTVTATQALTDMAPGDNTAEEATTVLAPARVEDWGAMQAE